MRILLTSNASHLPPRGGSTRSNLAWLEYLSACGHACRVVAPASEMDSPGHTGTFVSEYRGIGVHSVDGLARRTEYLREQIDEFQPDWVLVSSEDVGHVLLRSAFHGAPGRVVYLAHTPQFFPFGGQSWNLDPSAAELVRAAVAVVAIGHHTADYIFRAIGRMPVVIHPPIYGDGPFANLAAFDAGAIAMINPSGVKGIAIFLELARQFSQSPFAVLPGWATTAADHNALAALPNVSFRAPCGDIEEFLRGTRILLMPSLWYEGFGLIVVEAMLRGIPVIASDSGGLRDAKLGTRFVIPVRPIVEYEAIFDEHRMPRPLMPHQDLEPWSRALRALLEDRSLYEQESSASRRAALEFVAAVHGSQFEHFLLALRPQPDNARPPTGVDSAEALSRLSADKRELLLRRLRHKI